MVMFTYNDYLDCTQNYRLQKEIKTQHKKSEFEKKIKEKEMTAQEEIINGIIENVISKKEEVVKLINDFFKTRWEITPKNLESYSVLNNKIYKLKEKEIYFILKIEKKPNYHIGYDILSQCINLINNLKIKNKSPIIVPIVLYIGKEKWNVQKSNNIKYTSFEGNRTTLAYNIIDFNSYSDINLIKNNSLTSNISLLKRNIDYKIKKQIIQNLKIHAKELKEYLQISEIENTLVTK